MVFILFVIMGWLVICAFCLIPKALDKAENIIVFFLMSIVIMASFTLLSLNLQQIYYAEEAELHMGFLIERNIIIPGLLLICSNLFFRQHDLFKKIVIFVLTVSALCIVGFITTRTGIKTYTGWNGYLELAASAILVLLSILLSGILKRCR